MVFLHVSTPTGTWRCFEENSGEYVFVHDDHSTHIIKMFCRLSPEFDDSAINEEMAERMLQHAWKCEVVKKGCCKIMLSEAPEPLQLSDIEQPPPVPERFKIERPGDVIRPEPACGVRLGEQYPDDLVAWCEERVR